MGTYAGAEGWSWGRLSASGNQRRWRLMLVLVLVPLAALLPARATAAATADSGQLELAQRYAPLVAVQRHNAVCGPGERYVPTDVATVLDQPDVTLRDATGAVLTTAPTAADLYAASPDSYLDLPGDPLHPGCTYETRFSAGPTPAPVVAYARLVTDPDDGHLALQYWLYWVFNDWNDRHESDWEMLQLSFDVGTAAEALARSPIQVGVTQHEGNERRSWQRVQRVGDRPVVYAARGSHAMYFGPREWFGKSASSGFGCDDTRGPSTYLDPTVVLLPSGISRPADPFAWLEFPGRWGQKEPSFNNGPTGPMDNEQWTHPTRWMRDARDGAVSVPPLGTPVTKLFCHAAATGSRLYVRFIERPGTVLVAGLGTLVILLVLVLRTRWTPAFAMPVRARRRGGQILRSAWKLLFTRRRAFLPLSSVAIAGGVLAVALQSVVTLIPVVHNQATEVQGDATSRLVLALAAGAVVIIPVYICVFGASVVVAQDSGTSRGLGRTLHRARDTRVVPVVAALTVALAVVTVVVPPLAPYLAGRWAAAPSTASEARTTRGALRASSQLTRGHRLPTAILTSFAGIVTLGAGPLLGAIALVVTDRSFVFVNLLDAAVTAIMLPWLAIVVTMIHGDLEWQAGAAR